LDGYTLHPFTCLYVNDLDLDLFTPVFALIIRFPVLITTLLP